MTWTADTSPRILREGVVHLSGRTVEALVADTKCSEVQHWADRLAQALDELPHGLAFRLGEHTSDASHARLLAERIARVLRDALIRRGAPAEADIEVDAEQSTEVAEHQQYRTLLPHHDGGNASFLTPSLRDDPLFNSTHRRTFPRKVTTTRVHKMYQGFFLRAVGDFNSITTYYDLLAVLRSGFRHQTGSLPRSVEDLARWTGANLRRALSLIETVGGTYVTLAGMLGSTNPLYCVTAVHRAEAAFDSEQTNRYPALRAFNESGRPDFSPSERLLDQVLLELTGDGWLSFRERYEVGIEGVAYDFLLGHNLTLLHGGWRGGRGRIIEPICITLNDPSSDVYERWLSRAWRRPNPSAF